MKLKPSLQQQQQKHTLKNLRFVTLPLNWARKSVVNVTSNQFSSSSFLFQVLQRIDDVSLMCDKRIVCLKKLAQKPPRPVQQVIPEPAVPLQPPGGAPHPFRMRKSHNRRVSNTLTQRYLYIFFLVVVEIQMQLNPLSNRPIN